MVMLYLEQSIEMKLTLPSYLSPAGSLYKRLMGKNRITRVNIKRIWVSTKLFITLWKGWKTICRLSEIDSFYLDWFYDHLYELYIYIWNMYIQLFKLYKIYLMTIIYIYIYIYMHMYIYIYIYIIYIIRETNIH